MMKNTKTIRATLFAVFFLSAFACAASAQSLTPDALVKDLYKTHEQDSKTGKDRILSSKSRRYLDKYFDKLLADMIWKDLTTHTDDVGVIDFDPFYATQDPDIKNLTVGAAKVAGAKAAVIVRFTNSDVKETLSYQLVKRKSEWKIADIKYRDGSLLGFFKEAGSN